MQNLVAVSVIKSARYIDPTKLTPSTGNLDDLQLLHFSFTSVLPYPKQGLTSMHDD